MAVARCAGPAQRLLLGFLLRSLPRERLAGDLARAAHVEQFIPGHELAPAETHVGQTLAPAGFPVHAGLQVGRGPSDPEQTSRFLDGEKGREVLGKW